MPPAKLTAAQFRKELKFRSERLEDVIGVLPDGEPVTVTVKVDGELEVWEADVPAGVFLMHNRNARERHVVPIAKDLLKMLRARGHQSARGAGELYAVTKEGRPQSFERSISQVKTRAKADTPAHEQTQLRLAVFDLFELDGQALWGRVPYAERFALLYSLFSDGTTVRPVSGQTLTGEATPIGELWRKHVLDEHFEGLVLRTNGAIKIKPIYTVDLAVIAIQAGKGRHAGRMGALVTAYMDWTGRYVLAGKVGTGFTDVQREWWWATSQPVSGRFAKGAPGDGIRFVEPTHVVECEAERFIMRQATAWHWHAHTQRWVRTGTQPSAIMQKPRFVRRRDDKDLSPYDLRLGQVPGWGGDATRAKIPGPNTKDATKRFGSLLVASESDLARFASKLHVSPSDFEDLKQETYFKALRGWEKMRAAGEFRPGQGMPEPGKSLVTWLFTIFDNSYKSLGRKRAVRARKPAASGKRQVAELAELKSKGRRIELARTNRPTKRPTKRRSPTRQRKASR